MNCSFNKNNIFSNIENSQQENINLNNPFNKSVTFGKLKNNRDEIVLTCKRLEKQDLSTRIVEKLKTTFGGIASKFTGIGILDNIFSTAENNNDIKKPLSSEDIFNGLEKSIKNIPENPNERKIFLKTFFQTDLNTGEQIPFDEYYEDDALETIDKLANYNNEDLEEILKYSLHRSKVFNDKKPDWCGLNYGIRTYRNINNRNILSIIDQIKKSKQGIANLDVVIMLGRLSNNDYKNAYNLIQKINLTGDEIDLAKIIDFYLDTQQDTINYMYENDLFNPDNLQSFNYNREDFTKEVLLNIFKGAKKDSVEKMHKNGLLSRSYENQRQMSFEEFIYIAENLSEEELETVEKRNLFTFKTRNDKYLSCADICDLAKLPDDVFSKIEERGLKDKVRNLTANLIHFAQISDDDWQKTLDRGIDISKVRIRDERDLKKLLGISDEKWELAQKRGLKFISFKNDDEFKLLELNEEQWNNIIQRNLNEKDDRGDFIFDVDSQIRLSQLSDKEFDTALKRNLINLEHSYFNSSFSDEALMLTKFPDNKYSLYIKRGIDKIDEQYYDAPIHVKQKLTEMTDKQYGRIIDDIMPLTQTHKKFDKNGHYVRQGLSEYYRLAYLEDSEYEIAKLFLNLQYFESNSQFDFNEISKIIKLPPDRIARIRSIVAAKKNIKAKEHYSKSTLLNLAEIPSSEFNKIMKMQDYLSVSQIENYMKKNILNEIINSKSFNENKNLIAKINKSGVELSVRNLLVDMLLGLNNDYEKLNLKEKMDLIKKLKFIQSIKIFNSEEKDNLNIESLIERLQNSVSQVIQVSQVSNKNTVEMMEGFFANNNPRLDNLLSTTDFTIYGKNGLPLKYSRKNFLEDLDRELKNLSIEEQTNIINKLGIKLIQSDGKIKGYDGIIDLTKLANNGNEGKILQLANRFIKENSVKTGNKEQDKVLNSLIQGMPEFINIIGKQQHETHSYSLDIHILTVLKEAMSNTNYQKLSQSEKFCLKFAAILHDIAKAEGQKDKGHPDLSALYARDILNRDTIKLPDEMKDRIYELIKNHHWLADYNNGMKNEREIAALFRRKGDLQIAQIMAEADLKGVNNKFYKKFSSALNPLMQQPVEDTIQRINSNGQIFFTSQITNSSKIPIVQHNGKNYKVIDFTKMKHDSDLSQFGFEDGTTIDNLRLLVHTVGEDNIYKLETAYNLSDPSNEGFLCASYISFDNNKTYNNNRFGISLTAENVNIANANIENQYSGNEKNLSDFTNIIISKDIKENYRTLIPSSIKKELNISDMEYAKLYEIIQGCRLLSELEDGDIIQTGDKTFSGKEVRDAVTKADDLILKRQSFNTLNNEVNLYIPKTNAVIAKVNSMEEIPQELLDFAQKHNLPIYIMGK